MRERELFLQRPDPLHVVGAVTGDAADDGDHGGRRVDHPTHPSGLTACPARRHDEPVALIRTGGAAADVREVVGPGVHELQHVVRTAGVGDMQPDRPAGEVELGDRAERVVADGGAGVPGSADRPGCAKWLNGVGASGPTPTCMKSSAVERSKTSGYP